MSYVWQFLYWFAVVVFVLAALYVLLEWLLRRLGRRSRTLSNLDSSLDSLITYVGLPPTVGLGLGLPGVLGAPGGLLLVGQLGAFLVPDAKQTFHNPVWNLWAEQAAGSARPTFKPTSLEPNRDYSLFINLSALKFGDDQGKGGVFSKDTSSTFAQWLDQNRAAATDLTVVALADPKYFELRERPKPFRIDLAKIRKAKQDGFKISGSPFDHLRSHEGDTPFSFGLQSFRIRTKDQTGRASIALSIWADGKPVDELTLTLCIGSADSPGCTGSLLASNPLTGVDLTLRGIYPDMALHLIDRNDSTVGVMRCNTCNWGENEFLEWDLMETADWVAARMNEITASIGQRMRRADAGIRQIMENAGDQIFNVIFHVRDPEENEVVQTFTRFIAAAQRSEKNNESPPSLFTRIIPRLKNLRLAPIGMMRVKLSPSESDFVGFVTNVQTPLEYQDYSRPADCISQWALFVPPETAPPGISDMSLEAVWKARKPFKDWIGTFKKACADCVIDRETDFQKWLKKKPQHQGNEAVVILSHHNANALYFSELPSSPRVLSSDIARSFASPSFVILNACGTSEPGASEFLREFNFRGMRSAIATSTQVDPDLAGKFLATYMTLLQEHADDVNYTVGKARFDAVRALGRPSDSTYGAAALAFILAGNGGLRLCVPR